MDTRAVGSTRKSGETTCMARTTIAAVAGSFDSDVERSFAMIERALSKARAGGAKLMVFPECALGGYLDGRPPVALDREGPEITRLALTLYFKTPQRKRRASS